MAKYFISADKLILLHGINLISNSKVKSKLTFIFRNKIDVSYFDISCMNPPRKVSRLSSSSNSTLSSGLPWIIQS